MTNKELVDKVETLTNRLKRKDAYIDFLKSKLSSHKRMTYEIRELALKIASICDPTIGNTAEKEWDYCVNRVTNGTSIFLASDILERASSSLKLSDDETLQRETAGDETGGENVEPSQSCDLDSHFYSTSGRMDRRRRGNQNTKIKVIDKRVIQKPNNYSTEHDGQENPRKSAPVQSIEHVKRKMMIDQAKAKSFPGRRDKFKKSKPKPPEFKPYKWSKSVRLSDESNVHPSSAKVILRPNSSNDLSIERIPNKSGEPLPQRSNYNTSEVCSNAKDEPPFIRMLTDRSLSSIAKVLPSVPSPQFGSIGNIGLGRDWSNESEFVNLADEGTTIAEML